MSHAGADALAFETAVLDAPLLPAMVAVLMLEGDAQKNIEAFLKGYERRRRRYVNYEVTRVLQECRDA